MEKLSILQLWILLQDTGRFLLTMNPGLKQRLLPTKEFVCKPFGLCNAPATFQKVMQTGLEWHDCFVYIDDMLAVSRTFEEHLQHLEQVSDQLRKGNLRLKLKSVALSVKKWVIFDISFQLRECILIPRKQKVRSCTPQRNTSTSILRLSLLLQALHAKFSKITSPSPLHALINAFQWSSECSGAFQQFKDLLTS